MKEIGSEAGEQGGLSMTQKDGKKTDLFLVSMGIHFFFMSN